MHPTVLFELLDYIMDTVTSLRVVVKLALQLLKDCWVNKTDTGGGHDVLK